MKNYLRKFLTVILSALSFLAHGQKKLSAIPLAPIPADSFFSVVGVRDSAGYNVDYRYPINAIANYVSSAIPSVNYPAIDTFNVYSAGAAVVIYTATPTANTSYDITGYMNATSFSGNKAVLTVTFQTPATGSTTYRIDSITGASQYLSINPYTCRVLGGTTFTLAVSFSGAPNPYFVGGKMAIY